MRVFPQTSLSFMPFTVYRNGISRPTKQLFLLTEQNHVCRPLSADHVVLPVRPQHTRLSHQQHRIGGWMCLMSADPLQTCRRTQGMRLSKTKFDPLTQFNLITIVQQCHITDLLSANTGLRQRLEHIAVTAPLDLGVPARQVRFDRHRNTARRHGLTNHHLV